MFQTGITLALLAQLIYEINNHRVCVPNTYFKQINRLCYCNHQGTWSDASCLDVAKNHKCQTGDVTWQGCKRCICDSGGKSICTDLFCHSNNKETPGKLALSEHILKCSPFQAYYMNCNLCFCPASGQSLDAKCEFDKLCTLETHDIPELSDISSVKRCLPKVMYLYPCFHCLCNEHGFFDAAKCTEICKISKGHTRKCKAGALYRRNCEVCRCPDSGVIDMKLCVKANCNYQNTNINMLRTSPERCIPRTFTQPRCLFCECKSDGTLDKHACLELNCSMASYLKYTSESYSCIPGELVPICVECFCLNNGLTNETYCTRSCTHKSKTDILEKVLNDSSDNLSIMDKSKIERINNNELCKPNSLYIQDDKYCLCSTKGNRELYCSYILENISIKHKYLSSIRKIDTNVSCEPNTLVDFDCNTCYCSKTGKIDPKWCTYDDCEAKRLVQESHKSSKLHAPNKDANRNCTPGSISKIKCNYCICPDSGILKERACTKNSCFDNADVIDSKLTCEPLEYYEVDCNICYCPMDGLKNVGKCTKNQCQKTFLRTDTCAPAQLFSDKCNVCVCPPNGDIKDRVCTNHTCSIPTWNIFEISDDLLNNEVQDDTRSLDLCFPGEEFTVGCELCVCSDLGLKAYATCESTSCTNKRDGYENVTLNNNLKRKKTLSKEYLNKHSHDLPRVRRHTNRECFTYNISHMSERVECTPGSMYIVRCNQCICPYIGNINHFCRPLPKNIYCEQAFPGFNYLPMGRREDSTIVVDVKHSNHTLYKCHTPGKNQDECFICECDDHIVKLEHCYKSDEESCKSAKPTFLLNKVR